MKFLIVDDHALIREAMRGVLLGLRSDSSVLEAADAQTALQTLQRHSDTDLVLLDLHLPNLDGFGVVEALRQVAPSVRILVLSSHCDDYTVFRAEKSHVHGFVDKNTNTVAILKEAITAVGEGRLQVPFAHRYPLSDAAAAHARVARGGLGGKVLLIP